MEGADPCGFRLSFEDPQRRQYGVSGFLFRLDAASTGRTRLVTTIRLPDSFETGPGLRDPFGLFTYVLLGLAPGHRLVVGFDPARHFPEDEPLRVSISARAVRVTRERGWHSWLREVWEQRAFDFAEALVGFWPENLLAYLEFERTASGLDTGHRSLLAEAFLDVVTARTSARPDSAFCRSTRAVAPPRRARATRT